MDDSKAWPVYQPLHSSYTLLSSSDLDEGNSAWHECESEGRAHSQHAVRGGIYPRVMSSSAR